MVSFNNLVNDFKENEKIEDYLLRFFTKSNFKEYEISDAADSEQSKAIKIMFESKKDLRDRIDDAFSYDPFCKEAFFAYLMISEDVYVQLRFDTYLKELDNYPGFDSYQKSCYITILNFYVEFLLDISNITTAIRIQKLMIQLTNSIEPRDVSRLAYMYFSNEIYEDFYRLYLDNKFTLYDYLLLLVTLLKHEEEMKAREVLIDMFDNIEYGTYLDHVWDLDKNDPKQKRFMEVVNDCYEDLSSVPTFFSWVNKTREKYGK